MLSHLVYRRFSVCHTVSSRLVYRRISVFLVVSKSKRVRPLVRSRRICQQDGLLPRQSHFASLVRVSFRIVAVRVVSSDNRNGQGSIQCSWLFVGPRVFPENVFPSDNGFLRFDDDSFAFVSSLKRGGRGRNPLIDGLSSTPPSDPRSLGFCHVCYETQLRRLRQQPVRR